MSRMADLPARPAGGDPVVGHMIETHQIVKTFKNPAGEFPVLKGIDLVIERGQFVSIVGKSGSGKSTLLNMITGIDHPTSGRMIVGGVDIYDNLTEVGPFALAREEPRDSLPVLPVAADADPA